MSAAVAAMPLPFPSFDPVTQWFKNLFAGPKTKPRNGPIVDFLVDRFIKQLEALGLYMSVTHTTTIRNGITDYVVTTLNAGTPPGYIEFQTSGNAVVATLFMSVAAFGASSAGTATAAAITSDTNAAGGTIAKAVFKNAAGTESFRCSCTATGGGGDITFNSVVVSSGQTVSITSLTYSAPP